MINKQEFNNSFNQSIEMVRGDLMSFNFELEGLGDAEPTFTFSCCKKYGEAPLFFGDVTLIQSVNDVNTYAVAVAPEDTYDLDTGIYYYDLSFNDDGNIYTLMRGSLTLLPNVERS